jgi:hypothetical protein
LLQAARLTRKLKGNRLVWVNAANARKRNTLGTCRLYNHSALKAHFAACPIAAACRKDYNYSVLARIPYRSCLQAKLINYSDIKDANRCACVGGKTPRFTAKTINGRA